MTDDPSAAKPRRGARSDPRAEPGDSTVEFPAESTTATARTVAAKGADARTARQPATPFTGATRTAEDRAAAADARARAATERGQTAEALAESLKEQLKAAEARAAAAATRVAAAEKAAKAAADAMNFVRSKETARQAEIDRAKEAVVAAIEETEAMRATLAAERAAIEAERRAFAAAPKPPAVASEPPAVASEPAASDAPVPVPVPVAAAIAPAPSPPLGAGIAVVEVAEFREGVGVGAALGESFKMALRLIPWRLVARGASMMVLPGVLFANRAEIKKQAVHLQQVPKVVITNQLADNMKQQLEEDSVSTPLPKNNHELLSYLRTHAKGASGSDPTRDRWGTPFRLDVAPRPPGVRSAGPDKRFHTADDIYRPLRDMGFNRM